MSRRGCIGFFAHKIFIPPYLRFLPLQGGKLTKFSHQMKYVRCCLYIKCTTRKKRRKTKKKKFLKFRGLFLSQLALFKVTLFFCFNERTFSF